MRSRRVHKAVSRSRIFGKIWAACTYMEKLRATGWEVVKKRKRMGEGQNAGDSQAPAGTPARWVTRGTACARRPRISR